MNEKISTFAERLSSAMKANNFTQTELARKTKISKSLINKYLKGIAEAGNDNLPILAKALQVNVIWLMGYDVPNKYIDGDLLVKDEDNYIMFNKVLKSKGIIDDNDNVSQEDFEKLMKFIDNNKDLLIKKDRD